MACPKNTRGPLKISKVDGFEGVSGQRRERGLTAARGRRLHYPNHHGLTASFRKHPVAGSDLRVQGNDQAIADLIGRREGIACQLDDKACVACAVAGQLDLLIGLVSVFEVLSAVAVLISVSFF